MPSIINSDDGVVSGTSGLKTTGGNDGLLNIQSNGSTVVAVTGSGISVTGTVSQTGVSTFAAGTVSAPSITFTGDTNTGIFSPAADTIAFTEGGVESMRIDASGNVGVGVTPSASWGTSNFKALQIKNGSVAAQSTADLWLFSNAVYDGSNFKYVSSNPAANYRSDSGTHTWSAAASGTAGNNITFTQVLAVERTKSLALEGATSQSGTGITFPATQSASSDANTLDDYEEGTWTPTVTFGGGSTGITYNTRVGSYTKVGRSVTVQCYVYLSSKGSSTGDAAIAGLPFTSSSTTGLVFSGSIGGYAFMASLTFPIAQVQENGTSILLRNGGAIDDPRMTQANFNNGLILVTLTYFV